MNEAVELKTNDEKALWHAVCAARGIQEADDVVRAWQSRCGDGRMLEEKLQLAGCEISSIEHRLSMYKPGYPCDYAAAKVEYLIERVRSLEAELRASRANAGHRREEA